MKRHVLVACLLLITDVALAQSPALGFPPYGSFADGGFDAINRNNMNVNFAIPIVAAPSRGMNYNFSLTQNSLVWKISTVGINKYWIPVGTEWGWRKFMSFLGWSAEGQFKYCASSGEDTTRYYNWAYTDEAGTRHPFNLNFYEEPTACNFSPTGPRTGYATDNSGYYIDATDPSYPIIRTPAGYKVDGSLTDPNGNIMGPVYDTMGRQPIQTTSTNTLIEYKILDQNGNRQTISMNLQLFNIKSNFGCSGINEYTGSAYLPISIVLPNGKSYQFEYEVTPGFSSYKTGRIKKIILPTGGSSAGYYEYEYPAPNNGINCTDATVKLMKRRIHDGVAAREWEYSKTGSKTVVKAPQLSYDTARNESTFTFDASGRLTSTKIYQGTEGTGALLRTINTAWAANGTPASSTVVLDDAAQTQSKVETDFDTYGNLLEAREYALGPGAPGTLVRRTTNTYTTIGFIKNRVIQRVVKDGVGTVKSKTVIAYDGTTDFAGDNCITNAAQHDNTNYGCSFLARGNPVSVTTYANAAAETGAVTRNFTYDSLGNLRTADVNCCRQKEFKFRLAEQYAFPYEVVSGPSGNQLTTSAAYDFETGMVTSSTDENNKTTSFQYDLYNRLTKITRSDTTEITSAYDDTARTVTVTTPVDAGANLVEVSYFDPLGRLFKKSSSAPEGASIVETEFDELTRPYRACNPYRSGDTKYWTETRF